MLFRSLWDVATGQRRATLIGLPDGGYATLTEDGYKLDGNPADRLWWTIKLCRFAPGELDPYVRSIRHLPAEAEIHVRVAGARTTLRSE